MSIMKVNKKARFDEEDAGVGRSLTCCGLCYFTKSQKLLCYLTIVIPVLVIISLVLAILINTWTVKERFQLQKLSEDDISFVNPSNEEAAEWAKKLGGAIQFQTISWNDTDQNLEQITQFHAFLWQAFPSVFSSEIVQVELINHHSLLLRVDGLKETRNPYMLAAHLDVVPPGDFARWKHDPFLGNIIAEDGQEYIYGRGAIDDKHSVMGILQALEIILNQGERPARTFYIGLGHDEEIGGNQGAGYIAKRLESILNENEEQLDFLLDEGMTVMQGVVPGLDDPAIYIGVVEKGFAVLELSTEGEQKHSSTPPRHSAAGILAKALSKLEEKRSPAKFGSGPETDTMSYLAPHMGFIYKMALSNLWMFSDIVSNILGNDPGTDAIQRTTTAITIVNAGFKDNVVPGEAKAIVNHRIHPTEDLDDIVAHDKKVINDERVSFDTKKYFPPTPISPYSNDVQQFQIIANAALQVFPNGHITPGTMVANTDTKHYLHLTNNVYRFTPAFTMKSDISRFHGYDERISKANYVQVVEFYYRIMKNADLSVINKDFLNEDGSGSGDDHLLEGSGLDLSLINEDEYALFDD